VTVDSPDRRSFGDIAGGARGASESGYVFTVAPEFACGGAIVFDLVEITSTNARVPTATSRGPSPSRW